MLSDRPSERVIPLTIDQYFLQSSRDAGYLTSATAIAELVDNAIEAKATHIAIDVEKNPDVEHEPRILVRDNGVGMDVHTFSEALQFGGTSRFNSRGGLGRFGMGLPNASLSQSRRVDLFSKSRHGGFAHAFLDLDDRREIHGVVVNDFSSLPDWLGGRMESFQTAVVWSRCDRIAWRYLGPFTAGLHKTLGRIYRYFIDQGLLLTINGRLVNPVNPVLIAPSPDGQQARLLPCLVIPFRVDNTNDVSSIRVQFSKLPIGRWYSLDNRTKQAFNISRGAGVSVMRGNREVAYGWYFLGSKRRENYDDWWRCEVSFSPVLDEAFGVTNTKQGIRPTRRLQDTLSPILEGIARTLNKESRSEFEALKNAILPAESTASRAHSRVLVHAPAKQLSPRTSKTDVGSRLQYVLLREETDSENFLRVIATGRRIEVRLNTLHPFYQKIYLPLQREELKPIRDALDGFVLAFGSALGQEPATFLECLSNYTASFLEG